MTKSNDDTIDTHDDVLFSSENTLPKEKILAQYTTFPEDISENKDSIFPLLTVINSGRYWFLGGILFLVLSLVSWAYFGSLPVEIYGRGILMHKKGGFTIQAMLDGIVKDILVKPQSVVLAEEEILEIYDPSEELKLHIAEAELKNLKKQFEELKASISKETEAIRNSIRAAIKAKEIGIEDKKHAHAELQKDVKKKRVILKQGLISNDDLRNAEVAASQVKMDIDNLNVSMEGLKASLLEEYRGNEIKAAMQEIFQAESKYTLLKTALEYTKVRTPTSGTLLEYFVSIGEYVTTGQTLAWLDTLDSEENPLLIYSYFPIQQAKNIYSGQEVVVKIDYQSIKGTVQSVSHYAISSESFIRRYQSKSLGNYLKAGVEEVIEVVIVPEIPLDDPAIAKKISSGTVVTIDAVVEKIRPIDFLLARPTRY